MKNRIRSTEGFTLIELIMVMAILAVISAIAVPKFLEVGEKAKEDADYASGAMIAKAAELYIAKEGIAKNPLTIKDLSDGYINDVIFKSDKFKNFKSDDIKIELGDFLTVKIENGKENSIILYPRPKD